MAALSLKEFYHKYGTGCPNSWEQCEQIWNAATEYAVENCHSLQQLKAEICHCVDETPKHAIKKLIEMGHPYCSRCGGKLSAV